MYKYILLVFLLVSLLCCQSNEANMEHLPKGIPSPQVSAGRTYTNHDADASIDESTQIDQVNVSVTGNKIIKNGDLKFEVIDLEKAKSNVSELATKHKAYFENERYSSYGNRVSYNLLIRVPNEAFDPIIKDLEDGTGQLKSKAVSADDVTEEYVDLNIRLENNLAYLEQYKAILKKAKSIKEILEVQEKIRRIEEEIESKKGRLKFLDSKVKYSTINLELTELVSRDLSSKPKFSRRLANAFKNGVTGFMEFIIVLVNLWPFLLLFGLVILFRKRIFSIFKRNKNRKTKENL